MSKKRLRELEQRQFLSGNDIILLDQDNKTLTVSLSSIAEFVRSYINGGTTINSVKTSKDSDIITTKSTIGLSIGMKINGNNIPDGSYITEILGPDSFKISNKSIDDGDIEKLTTTTENMLLADGKPFTGISDGSVGSKDTVYKNGIPFSGVGDGVIGEKGKIYENGTPFNGKTKETENTAPLCYYKGELYTGVGDGKIGERGIVYKDGKPFNGIGTYNLGEDGKVYKNGILFDGEGTSDIGKQGIIYLDGSPFTGVGDGIVGKDGVLYTNGSTSILADNGVPFTGIGNGTTGKENILYKDGTPFNGVSGVQELLFSNGALYNGVGRLGLGLQGKIYANGLLFNGTGDGKLLGDAGVIYSNGVPFTGTGNGTIGTDGIIYSNGIPFTGVGNGTIGVLDKIYSGGKLLTGFGTKTLGKDGYVYSGGVLYTGTGSTSIGFAGIIYQDGQPVILIDNAPFSGVGDGIHGTLGSIYTFGVLFTGVGDGAIGTLGIIYFQGKPYTGTGSALVGVVGKIYSEGKVFNGTGDGTVGIKDKIYSNGLPFEGISNGTVGAMNILYHDGIPYNGLGTTTLGTDMVLYYNGKAFNGINPDPTVPVGETAGIAGLLYYNGNPFDGTGHDNIGTSGLLYHTGTLYNGLGTSTIGITDVLYKAGLPYTGFENSILYSSGKPYTGIGTGSIGILGSLYTNGLLSTSITVNYKLYSGNSFSSIFITPDNHIYECGYIYPRYSTYPITTPLPERDFVYPIRIALPSNITSNPRMMTAPNPSMGVNRFLLTDDGSVYYMVRDSINLAILSAIKVEDIPKITLIEQNNDITLALGTDKCVYELLFEGNNVIKIKLTGIPNVIQIKLAKLLKTTVDSDYRYSGLFLTEDKSVLFFKKTTLGASYTTTPVTLPPIKTIAISKTCAAIAENGSVYFFGPNLSNEYPYTTLAQKESASFIKPKEITQLRNITKDIVIGEGVCSVLTTTGKLSTFGTTVSVAAKALSLKLPEVYSIYGGGGNVFAVGMTGVLSSIGYVNEYGQIGHDALEAIANAGVWEPVYKLPNVLNTRDPSIKNYLGKVIAGGTGSTDTTVTYGLFNKPQGVAIDSSGNIYVSDTYNNKIRKVTPEGVVTTIAGGGASGEQSGLVDGTGTAALFNYPNSIVIDSAGANLYVVDGSNHKIRKIIISTGVVSTLAGGGTAGNTVGFINGSVKAAGFNYPSGITIDSSGNLYVADTINNKIRKVTPAGVVTTIAGGGTSGQTPGSSDGTGTTALFNQPLSITINSTSTNLYVADLNNHRIRKIVISTGVVTTLAGGGATGTESGSANGTGTAALFDLIRGVCVDFDDNICVIDNTKHKIRKITQLGVVTTFAGGSADGKTSGNVDGIGTNALFNNPYALAKGPNELYIADTDNNKIRKISHIGVVTTFAGGGPSGNQSGSSNTASTVGLFSNPANICFDSSGNAYIVDTFNHKIRKIVIATGVVTTIAGGGATGILAGSVNGTGTAALFSNPNGITIDSTNTNLYVTDSVNHKIRKIVIATGVVTTIAGGGATGILAGSVNGTGTAALFSNPRGITIDSTNTNLYVAEYISNKIRKIVIATGVVTTVAGGGSGGMQAGLVNGIGTAALFTNPNGITIDSLDEYLYITEHTTFKIRRVEISTGFTTTIAGGGATGLLAGAIDSFGKDGLFYSPFDITSDSIGNLYVADTGNHRIRKILYPLVQVVSDIAGGGATGILAGSVNGTGAAALFYSPIGITIDSSNTNLYVTDSVNHKIRKIVIATGVVTTIAGGGATGILAGSVNGTGTAALFSNPRGITIDSTNTNLYVADTNNQKIRKIVIATGVVTTVAGGGATGILAGSVNGTGTAALFNIPFNITIDSTNTNLYVADTVNQKIRKIVIATGVVTTVAGGGATGILAGYADGTGIDALFQSPNGITIDSTNTNLYVADFSNNKIRKIVIATGVVTTVAGGGAGGMQSGYADGIGTNALFGNLLDITIDSTNTNLYVTDDANRKIRKIVISTGAVSTIEVKNSQMQSSEIICHGITFGDVGGDLYITNKDTCTIKKITTPIGRVTTIAGSVASNVYSINDGVDSGIKFNLPIGIACDVNNNIYVTNKGTDTIMRLSAF